MPSGSAPSWAATYFIAPLGNNGLAGTSTGTAWKTFPFAVSQLAPGDTLNVMDGTYTPSANGGSGYILKVDCASGAVDGTSSNEITIKAVNERKARLSAAGSGAARFDNCSYWTIDGLYFSNVDNAAAPTGTSVVDVRTSNHLTFRRNLFVKNNRYYNGHLLELSQDVDHVLIEENEFYFYHRHGILLFGGGTDQPSFITVRRNYAHSRAYADIAGGYVSNPTTRGDVAISCYPCFNSLFENNIVETSGAGFDIQAKANAINNTYLGNIAYGNNYGLTWKTRDDISTGTVDSMPQNTTMHNNLALRSLQIGIYLRGNKNTTMVNNSIIENLNTSAAFGADGGLDEDPGDGQPTFTAVNTLIYSAAGAGISVTEHPTGNWDFDYSKVNGTAASNPTIPNSHYTNMSTTDPLLGTCRVFIPATSTAKGTGLAGADIGANILYRYVDGTLTTTPLWNTVTGEFTGCGAIVVGINDVAGQSCRNVHERLNVNLNGCSFPAGYATAPVGGVAPRRRVTMGSE